MVCPCWSLLNIKHLRMILPQSELNIDVLIAEIDRKIAELEASQADKGWNSSEDASDNKPK